MAEASNATDAPRCSRLLREHIREIELHAELGREVGKQQLQGQHMPGKVDLTNVELAQQKMAELAVGNTEAQLAARLRTAIRERNLPFIKRCIHR